MRMPSLAESSSHFTSEQKRLLKIAKIEVQAGARSRTTSGSDGDAHAKPSPPSTGKHEDWLFSKKGLHSSIATKEELLLNLLRNLDKPCDNMCTKTAGKDVETLHFCRLGCRKSKVARMKNLITELNSHSKKDASTSSSSKEHKSHSTLPVHAHSALEKDSKTLAATAKKLAHGNIAREEKLVRWAEKHGLQKKIGDDVLSRLEPQSRKRGEQHAGAQADEEKHRSDAKRKAGARPGARQRQAATRRARARDQSYLKSLSPHRRKLIHWAEGRWWCM